MEVVNRHDLKKLMSECQEYLALETHDYKLLEGEKLEQVMQLYGLGGFNSPVYYTNFLLVFTSLTDFDNLKFYIRQSKVLFKLELPEYDKYLIALEYFNDSALPNILTQ